jgi:hypothetical protein
MGPRGSQGIPGLPRPPGHLLSNDESLE